jgi:putative transposase
MFYGRHFDRSVIPCVRRYLAYGLSLHNLEEMMAERGISVDHAIIHCWTLPPWQGRGSIPPQDCEVSHDR